MNQKDPNEFSLSGLFIVTAISFFIFSGFVRLINGSATHSSLFFKIGIAALVLCGLSYLFESSGGPALKKKNKLSASSSDQD